MQIIPWRELVLSPKRHFGIIAAGDDGSISTQDLDALRLEQGSLAVAETAAGAAVVLGAHATVTAAA